MRCDREAVISGPLTPPSPLHVGSLCYSLSSSPFQSSVRRIRSFTGLCAAPILISTAQHGGSTIFSIGFSTAHDRSPRLSASLCNSTMSGRKLGGGRVLGSGKGLAPPSPNRPPARASSPFAPSDRGSSASVVSRTSTPVSLSPPSSNPLPELPQDLAAHVSVAGPSNGAASGELLCPICGEEMVC